MHYQRPAKQAAFKWTPSYGLGQCKYVCIRIFQTQLEPKQNAVENKWIEGENSWIKPHVGLIKIKYHFSGAHFYFKIHHIWGGLLQYGTQS